MKHTIIFFGLMITVILVYLVVKNKIEIIQETKSLVGIDENIVVQVESVEKEEKTIEIVGWLFGIKDSTNEDYEIHLFDLNKQSIIDSKDSLERFDRSDVREYFSSPEECSNAGFKAVFSKSKVNCDKGSYEVVVEDTAKNVTYHTGVCVLNGEIVYNNVQIEADLTVNGTSLESIVKNGELKAGTKKYGMYVYQYEKSLYWIWEKSTQNLIDENYYFILHYVTSNPELLIESRQQYGFENQDFKFEQNEAKELETELYRVAVSEIPDTYPITNINVGLYTGTNTPIWYESIKPDYKYLDSIKWAK